jgi:hypothetical protein
MESLFDQQTTKVIAFHFSKMQKAKFRFMTRPPKGNCQIAIERQFAFGCHDAILGRSPWLAPASRATGRR